MYNSNYPNYPINSIYRNTSTSVPTYNNETPAVPLILETEEELDFREKMGRKLGLASLIYAIFSTFCLYKNLTGVTMPFFGIATLIYMIYGFKQYDVKMKKTSWFYGTVLLALTISNFLTGNITILFFNNIGIVLMLFVFLLHNVYDDSRWNFSKTTLAICESLFCSISSMDDFSKDMHVLNQRRSISSDNEKKRTIKYVLIGILIAIPLVIILLSLLSAADLVFSNLADQIFKAVFSNDLFDIENIIGITITFTIIFFSAYCIMRFFSKKSIKEEVTEKRNMEPVIAITVLSIVSVIYLLFSVIQIVYLFMGNGVVPGGYTYSQYAREGFFQLLAVSIINFFMVLFINNHFKENLVLKILMTVISLCTYIMIASSYFRIKLYIDACLLTNLRIWVLWGLTVLSLLFAAVIISIYKHNFPLFKYSIIVVSLLYVLIGFIRPDYIIADYNLKYMNTIESSVAVQDYDYLTRLSTDAAPIIAKHNEEWADEYFKNCKSFYKNRSWRQFNTSAYTAQVLSNAK
ncbi:MAG: DUF4173 domain-containing protein [Eubacterium sp.]|nr:DUF4173 domain-containing protein [Eubacterium sp.]